MGNNKRLALFLDGTWNTVKNNTNVWRARSLCVTNDEQISYYNQGVGTVFGQRYIGGLFGYGLDAEVIRAYEWLVENYESNDRIYIFGFSRGAFTARALSGLISKCGLLVAGSPLSVAQLYARYRNGKVRSIRELAEGSASPLSLEERWIRRYSRAIPIRFIGVWDTVGALGIPIGRIRYISRSQFKFLQTDLWIDNDFAYQALALDEHRKTFKPTFWTWHYAKDDPEAVGGYAFPTIDRVEQRWFAGAHANVGGGYSNDILAQRPLKWLLQKAADHGMVFRDFPFNDLDEQEGHINNSFLEMGRGAYALAHLFIPYERKIGQPTLKTPDGIRPIINETIDQSIFARWSADKSYRPKNLAKWAARHKVDPGALASTVRADNPSIVVT